MKETGPRVAREVMRAAKAVSASRAAEKMRRKKNNEARVIKEYLVTCNAC